MNSNLMVMLTNGATSASGALAPTKSIWRRPMKKIKTLTALIILSTAVATPVFAKGMNYHSQSFRKAYNQVTVPSLSTQEERNIENFGFSGKDPSRVGGEDPSLRPSGS
jgi:hypothetical protein